MVRQCCQEFSSARQFFLPTVAVMQEGRGSGFYLSSHMQNILRGNILDTISQYRIGGTSDRTFRLPLLRKPCSDRNICILSLAQGPDPPQAHCSCTARRHDADLLLAASVFHLSLFKRVDSYYSRYGYIGVLVLLFIAAMYLQHVFPSKGAAGRESAENGSLKKAECLLPLLCSVLFCALLLTAGNRPTLEVEGVRRTPVYSCLAQEQMYNDHPCSAFCRSTQNTRRLLAGIAADVLVLMTIGE